MQYTSKTSMTTETKVAIGILAVTVAIIIGGLAIFKNSASSGTLSEDTVLKNIDTGLSLDPNKVAPAENPKITGSATTTTGSSTEHIYITEFMDYECPACAAQGEAITKELLQKYGNRLTITRRILPIHGQPAIEVARMVLASQKVSGEAYQKLHEKVFETQATWARLGTKERETYFRNMTEEMGLNYDTLVADGKAIYADQIVKDQADAVALGIRATPSFIINNSVRVTGGVPPEYFDRYIDAK
jgi:protein-disulfide isomerase